MRMNKLPGLVSIWLAVLLLAPNAQAQPASVSLVVAGTSNDNNPARSGETLVAAVGFDKPVEVTGTPTLAFIVGTATRQADQIDPLDFGIDLDALPQALQDNPCKDPECFLLFGYVIQPSDLDTDGISIPADGLRGTIAGTDGTPANLDLGSHAVSNDPGVRVDGNVPLDAPSITGLSHSTPDNGHTYLMGETIYVGLIFDQDLVVEGSPRLALLIGEITRYADYDALNSRIQADSLSFTYTVQAGDRDDDGISLPANPVDLNGGSVSNGDGVAAELSTSASSFGANQKVDGGTPAPAVPAVGLVILGLLLVGRRWLSGVN